MEKTYRAGMHLRRIRQDEGLTLKQMEERTGIPYQLISSYERGSITNPSGEALSNISRGYRLPIDEVYRLFGYEVFTEQNELIAK